jgi:LCP family protein required for cell wall assembly
MTERGTGMVGHRVPVGSGRSGRLWGRAAFALASVAVVAVTGVSWWGVHHVIGGITVSRALDALGVDAPRSGNGAMNVLLIGLDSRKDQNGNDLPQGVLDKLHAGDSDAGGYNTNTLILVHIGADDQVRAFSIPRDDYVAVDGIVPGSTNIKIKEAYGLTKADAEQKLVDEGVGDQETLESKGREAGRAATLKVVQDLTGVPIDYFAEINLAGFYDLTESLGGVQVCLNSAVSDDYSGADFPAGNQTLDAEQAVEFVRQRHGLDNGDLDRTRRQQAFLVSVMHQLQDSGSLADFSKLKSLIAVADKDVVVSTGWGEDQFRRVAELAGSHVEFQTLPVLRYDNVDGQDVNIIDAAAIKAQVTSAFEGDLPDITPAPTTVVDVVNAGSTPGLAATVSGALHARGYGAGEVRNASSDEPTGTAVEVGVGADSVARELGTLLGLDTEPQADAAVAAGHVRIVLGAGYVPPATLLDPISSPAAPESTIDSTAADSDAPDQGQPISSGQIPCVN